MKACGSILERRCFYKRIIREIKCFQGKINELLKSYYGSAERQIPTPINMDLYAEYVVMLKLLQKGLDATHNKEQNWPTDASRAKTDVCISSEKEFKFVEVKYSKYWTSTTYPHEWKWQFQNINPENFDFLVLVANAKNKFRFFIFTKEEAKKYIPPFDWAWKPAKKRRWVGICESKNDFDKHMKEWNPKKENPKKAKDNYMLVKNKYLHYINTHLNDFEDKWNKMLY